MLQQVLKKIYTTSLLLTPYKNLNLGVLTMLNWDSRTRTSAHTFYRLRRKFKNSRLWISLLSTWVLAYRSHYSSAPISHNLFLGKSVNNLLKSNYGIYLKSIAGKIGDKSTTKGFYHYTLPPLYSLRPTLSTLFNPRLGDSKFTPGLVASLTD